MPHKKDEAFDGSTGSLTKDEVDLFKTHELQTEASKISNTRFRVL